MNKIRKGNLVGLSLKNQAKSRKTDSSIGYFDFGGKAIVPYNLKHYLRFCLGQRHASGNKLSMGGSGAKLPIKYNNKLVELPWLTDIKTPGSILQIPAYSSGALSESKVTSLASNNVTGSKSLASDGSSKRMASKSKNSQQD